MRYFNSIASFKSFKCCVESAKSKTPEEIGVLVDINIVVKFSCNLNKLELWMQTDRVHEWYSGSRDRHNTDEREDRAKQKKHTSVSADIFLIKIIFSKNSLSICIYIHAKYIYHGIVNDGFNINKIKN